MKHDYFYDKRENVDSLTKLYNREVIFGYIDILITKKKAKSSSVSNALE